MRAELKETLELARSLGAEECDVILTEGKSLSLNAQEGRIDKHQVTSSRVIGVRVIREHRTGISYSEDLSPSSLRTMVESALHSSRYSEPDETQSIRVPAEEILDLNEEIYRKDETPIEEKIALALRLEREVRSRDARVSAVPYNGFAEGESHHHYANHLGLSVYEREKSFSCYTSALMKDGAKNALYYRGRTARTFLELDPEGAISETLDLTSTLLDATPVPTGRYDVVFDPEALQSLLSCFTGLFSGKAVKEGYSRFADSLGKSIAHPELTLSDRPRFAQGFHQVLTDSEGVRKKDLTFIENGVLRSFYHNTATARHFGVESTGHASRGPKSHLGTSLTQLVIEPGSAEKERIWSGPVLRIFALDGLHAGVNASSGAFSLAASGELRSDGKVLHGVKGITLSGNFFDWIRNIGAIGNELQSTKDRGFFAPEVRFSGLQVAG